MSEMNSCLDLQDRNVLVRLKRFLRDDDETFSGVTDACALLDRILSPKQGAGVECFACAAEEGLLVICTACDENRTASKNRAAREGMAKEMQEQGFVMLALDPETMQVKPKTAPSVCECGLNTACSACTVEKEKGNLALAIRDLSGNVQRLCNEIGTYCGRR